MPNFVQLTQEEMNDLSRRRNPSQIEQQKELLRNSKVGDIYEIELAEGEIKRNEKRRMSVAATATGKEITWIKPLSGRILFKVVG